ncbi:YesX [Paenibacillus mucilaginosus KNP414]|uniref:YesX n=1 Tax=Paenibacillus mucilaginosus (strain KNP414) TaxID=1036673 RepID=F8FJH1_PAEMK|nr:YesX [Paenibacillus mucilaginosus KNP414]
MFDSKDPGNGEYAGQGNHSLAAADVDGDGFDEIVYGAATIDHDGTGLYSTGWGHGDALHVSDLDPSRPGMGIYKVYEDNISITLRGSEDYRKPGQMGLDVKTCRRVLTDES